MLQTDPERHRRCRPEGARCGARSLRCRGRRLHLRRRGAKPRSSPRSLPQSNVGLSRAQYEHAIAMLLGKVATDFSIPVKPMIYTPPAIPTGVPSQLAERRPDVAAAERTLAAANATIGIGYGAFFPQVTISAAGGFESSLLKHLVRLAEPLLVHRPLRRADHLRRRTLSRRNYISTRRSITAIWPPTVRPSSPHSSRSRMRWPPRASIRSRFCEQQEAVKVLAGVPRSGDAALQLRCRSLCRCRHRADHAAQ